MSDLVLVPIITGGFALLAILLKWLIDKLDKTNTAQHADNKAVLESIWGQAAANGTAIAEVAASTAAVATALSNHLTFHVEHDHERIHA